MNAALLTATIITLVAEYSEDGITPPQINNGYCADFASVVWERLGRPDDSVLQWGDHYEGNSGHTWLEFGGLCYDAEVPHGIADWRDFPLWKRT